MFSYLCQSMLSRPSRILNSLFGSTNCIINEGRGLGTNRSRHPTLWIKLPLLCSPGDGSGHLGWQVELFYLGIFNYLDAALTCKNICPCLTHACAKGSDQTQTCHYHPSLSDPHISLTLALEAWRSLGQPHRDETDDSETKVQLVHPTSSWSSWSCSN